MLARAVQSGVGPALLWYPPFRAGEKSAMDSYDASSFRVRRFLFILTVVVVSVVTTGCSGGGASGTAGNSSGNIFIVVEPAQADHPVTAEQLPMQN
jgi:hypothetical protein